MTRATSHRYKLQCKPPHREREVLEVASRVEAKEFWWKEKGKYGGNRIIGPWIQLR